MIISNEILNDVIHCCYKAYLKKISQPSTKSEFETVVEKLKEKQKVTTELKPISFKNAEIDLVLDGIYKDEKNYSVPILISPFEKVQKADKLFIALQSCFLKQKFNLKIEEAETIFGKQQKKTKIILSKFTKELKKLVAVIEQIEKTDVPPLFYKNSHCQICEFNLICDEKLRERDDLSLLGNLKPKEIEQKNNRGIFSVMQLSYTFRPKKNPYRKRKFLPELKALAIREQKVFIQKLPELEQKEIEIFFDIEGIPDRDFYYLIGVIIKSENSETEYSFWADETSQQQDIFIQFVNLLDIYSNFILYHYGSYEIQALKRISKKLPKPYQDKIKFVIENSFNILTLISNDIYIPTYTNGLKDIAKYLGFNW
jgi:predicted RecB family nuclease